MRLVISKHCHKRLPEIVKFKPQAGPRKRCALIVGCEMFPLTVFRVIVTMEKGQGSGTLVQL